MILDSHLLFEENRALGIAVNYADSFNHHFEWINQFIKTKKVENFPGIFYGVTVAEQLRNTCGTFTVSVQLCKSFVHTIMPLLEAFFLCNISSSCFIGTFIYIFKDKSYKLQNLKTEQFYCTNGVEFFELFNERVVHLEAFHLFQWQWRELFNLFNSPINSHAQTWMRSCWLVSTSIHSFI